MYKVCFTCNKCQYDLNKHFHDSDKMPKHVEMVQTKCQPKIGTDKMPTTIKVWTICQPFVGILSAHRWIVALTTFVGRFSSVI